MSSWWEDVLAEYSADEVHLFNAGVGTEALDTSLIKEALNKQNIPVWVNIRGNHLSAVNRCEADYVLVHISYSNNLAVGGKSLYRIGKHAVRCTVVPCDDLFLYYLRTNTDTSSLPPRVLQSLSVAYSAVDQFDYSDFSGFRYLRRVFEVDRKIISNHNEVSWPREGEFDRAKVTAEHHTHYRPEELSQIIKESGHLRRAANIVLSRLRKVEGVTEAVVSTFLCYILYARPQVAYLIACSKRLWREQIDVLGLANILKTLSTPLKSMQRHEILDLSQMFELQVLVNRGVGKVDWSKEKENRLQPNVVKVDPRDVYREARQAFQMGKRHGYRYTKMDMNKYIDCRWEWVPSGSVHSQYADDKRFIAKNYRHRTKFVTLNMMDAEHIRGMFNRRPEIHAWASVKYEWAKQRAIYGVDLTSTVLTNYAMYRCEEVLKHRFPVGEDAEAGRVHKRLKYMLQDAESYCYDFDDFNAQHSIESMQAVLLAYQAEFSDDMSDDQKLAMEWVIQSVGRMIVHNNEEDRDEQYELAGTLMSGWRLTTFMNSVLNYVYFRISGALDQPDVIDSVHNGDDVLLSVKSLRAVLSVDHHMSKINARSQPAKCNAFSIGEFLRVEHKIDKDKGLGAQYLARAAATMVHSRIESQVPTRVGEALKAYVTRAEEIASRTSGAEEISAKLLDLSIIRLARVFGVEQRTLRKMVQAHCLVGGCISDHHGKIDLKFFEEVEWSENDDAFAREQEFVTVDQLAPGINDYTRRLTQQYFGLTNSDKVRSAVTAATRRQLAVTRKTRLHVEDVSQQQRYGYGRALYGLYKRVVNIPYLEKAKFVGIPPIALLGIKAAKYVKRLIADVADPEYALRVYL